MSLYRGATILISNMNVIDIKTYIEASENWGKSGFKSSCLSEKVIQLNFVAHENTANQGDKVGEKELPPTNHWTLFLTIKHGSSKKQGSSEEEGLSVRVEVAPDGPGKPGMVIIGKKTYGVSNRIAKAVSIDVPKAPTVADIFNIIIQKRRDYYIFAPEGEGCRFWLYTLAEDFVGADLISKPDAESVQSALKKYWPYPTGTPPVDRAMTPGRFFEPGH